MKRRKGKSLDFRGPGGLNIGLIDDFPEEERQATHNDGDNDAGTIHRGVRKKVRVLGYDYPSHISCKRSVRKIDLYKEHQYNTRKKQKVQMNLQGTVK
nr:hypothetical protein [uncultured Desulfobulbus sp.]